VGTALQLFVIIEERQQRDDERSDVGEKLNPIEEIHTRHLLPSRKKPTHRTACKKNISQRHKLYKRLTKA